jgi:hypothetical protein
MRKMTAGLAAVMLLMGMALMGPALAGDATSADSVGANAAGGSVSAGNVSGPWKWTIKTPDGDSIDMSAKLTQDGEKLSGVFVDGFDQKSFDITDGKVKDGNVSFTVTRPFNDDTITVKYNGKLSGDTIKGTLEVKFGDQDPMKNDWVATRGENSSSTAPSTQP